MRKIWTVWDNLYGKELGAFWSEDEALSVRSKFLKNEDYYEEDIIVEPFTVIE